MNLPLALQVLDIHAGRLQRPRVGIALVAQRVELTGDQQRWRVDQRD